MRANLAFVLTLWAGLIGIWLFSGEEFLDLVFLLPDAGGVDDAVIAAVVRAEEWKARLGLPDLFAALRGAVHRTFGLG